MTLSEQHKQDLDRLAGISLRWEEKNGITIPLGLYEKYEQPAPLRILPAEEEPKDAKLLRLDKKCGEWAKAWERNENLIYGATFAGVYLYFAGKGMGWW